jgi:hypothetical protein
VGKRKRKRNPNSPDFEEFRFFESPDFDDRFQEVAHKRI